MLRFLKNDKLIELEKNIEMNIANYSKKKYFLEESDYIESNIFLKKIDLKLKDCSKLYDLENTKILYSALKHLTPLEASDERIWVGMTHSKEGMEYVKERWSITEETSINSLKTRYFNNELRNSYSRLWWYGYVSYNKELKNPWELTEVLLKKQDLTLNLMERAFSRNKDFIQKILRAFKNFEEKYKKFPKGDEFKKITKNINRISAITLLDLLEVEDFEKEIEKVCL